MTMAGRTRGPTLFHFLLVALAAMAAGLVIWLLTRHASRPSREDAGIVAEQRSRLESEQSARGLVEVQASR